MMTGGARGVTFLLFVLLFTTVDGSSSLRQRFYAGSLHNFHFNDSLRRLTKRQFESACGWNEAKCHSGECIPRSYVCDGTPHCRDGSDEQSCGAGGSGSCEANEFQCDNKNCVDKTWICDGEDDCEDGSDERNCQQRRPGERCAPYQFQCASGECIAASFQCDGENDCWDESDEIGCAPPVAVQPPIQSLRIPCGGRAVLECRAVGVPTPYINWRLNWGKTCGPPRCSQTSQNGHGILIINAASTLDQGAYTCEALNSKGRILVTPDTAVRVDCEQRCNRAGTLYQTPDNKCVCKAYVEGEYCDRCIEGTFQLSEEAAHGCLDCYCSGLSKECQNADLFKATTSLSDILSYEIVEKMKPRTGGMTDYETSELTPEVTPDRQLLFNVGRLPPSRTWYWSLPKDFLNDRVTSYGGYLNYTTSYRGSGGDNRDPMVILQGKNGSLNYFHLGGVPPEVDYTITVHIKEDSFKNDGEQAPTRSELMHTLSNLKGVLLKLSHRDYTESTKVVDVTMDYATNAFETQEKAWNIEQCVCPMGYTGTSCERCSMGYGRLPDNICHPCQCHGHSSQCDPETGQCKMCEHNTEGDHCENCRPGFSGDARRGSPNDCQPSERCICYNHSPSGCDEAGQCKECTDHTVGYHCDVCEPGFYGDATRGTPGDCRPCPCPYGIECYVDEEGRPTCSRCPVEYMGKSCELCSPGYVRDPANPKVCIKPEPLKATIEPSDQVEVDEGSKILFQCSPEPESPTVPYEYIWSRVDRASLPANSVSSAGALNFYSVTQNESGRYRCTIRTPDEEASSEVELFVRRREAEIGIRPIIDPSTQLVRAGEPVQFRCSVEGEPEATITWQSVDNSPLPPDVEIFNSILVIRTATKSHEGTYYCTATTPLGSKTVPAQLFVQEGDYPPEPITDPLVLTVNEGEPAEFRCFAVGSPPPSYLWTRARGRLAGGTESVGDTLRILRTTAGDAGTYYCNASNSQGYGLSAVELVVNPRYPGQSRLESEPEPYTEETQPTETMPPYETTSQQPEMAKPYRREPYPETYEQTTTEELYSEERTSESHKPERHEEDERRRPPPVYEPEQPPAYKPEKRPTPSEEERYPYRGYYTEATPEMPERREIEQLPNGYQEETQPEMMPEPQPYPYEYVTAQPTEETSRYPYQTEETTSSYPYWTEPMTPTTPYPYPYPAETSTLYPYWTESTTFSTLYPYPSPPETTTPEPYLTQPTIASSPYPYPYPYPYPTTEPLERHPEESPEEVTRPGDEYGAEDEHRREKMDRTTGPLVETTSYPPTVDMYGTTEMEPTTPQRRLYITPPSQTVRLGDSVEMHCYSYSRVQPSSISWSYSFAKLPLRPGIEQTDGRLQIKEVQSYDKGEYWCTAIFPDGEESEPSELNVEPSETNAPSVTIEPMTEWEGDPGEDFTFYCKASGDPEPTVSWYRQDEEPMDVSVKDFGNGTLQIKSLSPAAVGDYVCSAFNPVGSTSATARVTQRDPEALRIWLNPPAPEITLREGDPLKLECFATGRPEPTVSWIFVDSDASSTHEGGRSADVVGNLVTHPAVTKANEGTYECHATNGIENRTTAVVVKVIARVKRQVMILGSSERVAFLGEHVELKCVVPHSTANDVIWWTRVGGQMSARHEEQLVGVLTISDFRAEDVGIYQCSLFDTTGNHVVSAERVKIILLGDVPVDSLALDGYYVGNFYEGENLDSRCYLLSDTRMPDSRLQWFRVLPDGTEEETKGSGPEDGQLKIENLSVNDSGMYKCVRFMNGQRDGDLKYLVLVSEKPESPSRKRYTGTQGKELEIRCPIYIVSGMSVSWSRVDGDMPDDVGADQDMLIFPNFQPEKAGVYKCEGIYDDGMVVAYVDVAINGTSDDDVSVSIDMYPTYPKMNDNVVLKCTVVNDDHAAITWEKMGAELPPNSSAMGNTLVLYGITPPDEGIYRCKAIGESGEVTNEVQVQIARQIQRTRLRRV